MPPDTCACSKAKGFEVGGNFDCDGSKACSFLKEVTKVRGAWFLCMLAPGGIHTEGHTHKAVLPAGTGVALSLVYPCTEAMRKDSQTLGCTSVHGMNGWFGSACGALCVHGCESCYAQYVGWLLHGNSCMCVGYCSIVVDACVLASLGMHYLFDCVPALVLHMHPTVAAVWW